MSTDEMLYISDDNNLGNESQVSGPSGPDLKRSRRITSNVWEEFEKLPKTSDDKLRAKCKKCGIIYIAESSHGTSNLRRHIKTCPRRDTKEISQMFLSQESSGLSVRGAKLNQDEYRQALAKVIVQHGYPFQFVEHEAVRQLHSMLNIDVKAVSRNTIKSDVLKMYKREKEKLKQLLAIVPGRICLTSDLWTSITTDGYICITTHFLDKDWKLNKRILNYRYMPSPHTGVSIMSKMSALLDEWGIEKKLFSITLDNASANETFVEAYQNKLNLKNALLLNGRFFRIRCCAHILNLIVQEGLKEVDRSIHKIRESVKFVKGSQARKERFKSCLNELSIDGKRGLRQDVPTRWNSTYLMLENALSYRNAFCQLALYDSNYKDCPLEEEWGRIEKINKFLKIFNDLTNLFSGSKYPTSNLYFQGVWKIQLRLKEEMESEDIFMKSMAQRMRSKFEKYWGDYSIILSIASVFDPRYKMKMVEFSYNKLYGDEGRQHVTRVKEEMVSLFNEYMSHASSLSSNTSSAVASTVSMEHDSDEDMHGFEAFESQAYIGQGSRSQLEMYLEETTCDRKQPLDILLYWKSVEFRFPELSLMARDVLTIPISTVASESAFSCGGRIVDQFRSSLLPENVEALVCTRDWVYGSEDNDKDKDVDDFLQINISESSASNEECF